MPIAGTHFVRPAVSADFSAWKPLWDGYNAFYGRQPDEDITRTTWARFSDPAEPMHALVVEQDGKLVGLVHYLFHRSTSMIAPTCYLQDLFTSEALRAQQRWSEISGVNRIHYCGAYWFNGFHEDGLNSALRVARSLGVNG